MCQKKICEDKHVDLLFIGEGEKNTMLCSDILTHSCIITHYIVEKKQFCHYFLQAFITAETLKCHIQDYFKINGRQRIEMTAKGAYVKFKIYESKIRLPFLSMQILKVC